MKTWEIIKTHICKNTTEGTLGRDARLNDAADLFLTLKNNNCLTDEALISFNNDLELSKALLIRKDIKSMRESGILR